MRHFYRAAGVVLATLLAGSTGVVAQEATASGPVLNFARLGQVSVALIFVLVVIGVVAVLGRRLPAVRNTEGKQIDIIESAFLGQRERLVLVQVDGSRVLVGISAGRMQPLCVTQSNETAAALAGTAADAPRLAS